MSPFGMTRAGTCCTRRRRSSARSIGSWRGASAWTSRKGPARRRRVGRRAARSGKGTTRGRSAVRRRASRRGSGGRADRGRQGRAAPGTSAGRGRMASKKTLNLDNLQALGARRLAELLLELAAGDAAAKRRLRLELSAEAGPEAVAADIGKRLAALRQARSFVDWQKRPAFVRDLDQQRRLILDKVGEDRPDLALELLWRFTALAGPVLERVDDESMQTCGDDQATVGRTWSSLAGRKPG